jgi:hypothetical protein
LVCVGEPGRRHQAGARDWLRIKLKRDYRTELSDTADLFTDMPKVVRYTGTFLYADQHEHSL